MSLTAQQSLEIKLVLFWGFRSPQRCMVSDRLEEEKENMYLPGELQLFNKNEYKKST